MSQENNQQGYHSRSSSTSSGDSVETVIPLEFLAINEEVNASEARSIAAAPVHRVPRINLSRSNTFRGLAQRARPTAPRLTISPTTDAGLIGRWPSVDTLSNSATSDLIDTSDVVTTQNPFVFTQPCASVFSQSAQAILEYQRDSRIGAVDPQKPAPELAARRKVPSLGKKTTFAKCNTCETSDGAYTLCEHSDTEDFDTTVNVDRIAERIQPKHLGTVCATNTLDVEMFKARNLSELLSVNCDEHASKYIIHTIHGTLLAYSDSVTIHQGRKLAALTSLTWRSHAASLTSSARIPGSTSVQALKTLQTTAKAANGGLSAMVAEVDELWLAVCYIKEQLLVSAIITKDPEPKVEKKQVTASTTANEEEMASVAEPTIGSTTERATSTPTPTNMLQSFASGSTECIDSDEEEIVFKPKSRKSPALSQESLIERGKEPSKMQILQWKAEGMAEELHKQLADFKMPEGAY